MATRTSRPATASAATGPAPTARPGAATDPGAAPASEALRARERTVLPPAVQAEPMPCWERAEGTRVWDVDGREYLDFTSGVLVMAAGHGHPRITAAIAEQAARLVNCYAAPHPGRSALAEELLAIAGEPLERALFVTTGSEAIDAGLKLARAATGRAGVLTFSGAFHGRTLAGVSVGGLDSLRQGLGQPLPHVVRAPFPYPYRWQLGEPVDETAVAAARDAAAAAPEPIGAILVEPFLGAGGVVPASPGFMQALRQLADELGALLVLDEIQSGLGRCGRWFAFHGLGVAPDVVIGAKGLGGGLPITAVLTRADIADRLPPGSMTSTFGGNPLACAAGLATLAVMRDEGLVENAARVGEAMLAELRSWIGDVPYVGDPRGAGLSFGVELVSDLATRQPVAAGTARQIGEAAWDQSLVILPPAGPHGNVLRFAPALAMPEHEALDGLARLRRAIEAVAAAA